LTSSWSKRHAQEITVAVDISTDEWNGPSQLRTVHAEDHSRPRWQLCSAGPEAKLQSVVATGTQTTRCRTSGGHVAGLDEECIQVEVGISKSQDATECISVVLRKHGNSHCLLARIV